MDNREMLMTSSLLSFFGSLQRKSRAQAGDNPPLAAASLTARNSS
jgi:hypothetical protein